LEALDHHRLIRFEVEDEGIGMTAEIQAAVFQLFNQGDNSLTRKYGGAGLGLALCRRLVKLMGGKIGVVSAPDQGSKFWFSVCLPVGEPPVPGLLGAGTTDWQDIPDDRNHA
jgi:signal transduction histidine kinase